MEILVTETNVMRALVDIQRTQILLAKLAKPTADLVPNSYAYALDKRLCPVFDTEDGHPFDEGYEIKRGFANSVLTYFDQKWLAGEALSFYDLEAHFGRERVELIHILRYAHLSRRFDDAFFSAILANCPSEAHGLNDPFDPSELGVV